MLTITDSNWDGDRGSGILLTSSSGELFSITSSTPTKIYRHYDGVSTSLINSVEVLVSSAAIDSADNIILGSTTAISTAGDDDRLVLSFDYNGVGTWIDLPGIRELIGAGTVGISALTLDSDNNIYIAVGMASNINYRIIKINKNTDYSTYEVIAGHTSDFTGNTEQDDNTDPLLARVKNIYAMDFDSYSDLYFINWTDMRIMRLASLPTTSTRKMLEFKLTNIDNGTIKSLSYLYTPLDVTSVNVGGNWPTNSSEIFNGHISKIVVKDLNEETSSMNTLPQTYNRSIYTAIPESSTIQVISAWTESIYTPETSTTVYIDGYTTTITVTTLNFEPMAFMSRLDYFVVTIDSFTNITKMPVNFLDIELLNTINTDLEINMVKNRGKYTIEVTVNSNDEVKWFGVLNLKKIYIKNAENRSSDNDLKYSTSDNTINWQPIHRTSTATDICFKFIEGLEFKNISPFSGTVVDETTTYDKSVIDDTLIIRHKSVALVDSSDLNSAREQVNNEFIDSVSSSYDYNIYGYQSMLMIQPTLSDTKRLTTSYSHVLYMNNTDGNTDSILFENEFGNSFTKDSTKDSSEFMTSVIDDSDSNEYYMSSDNTTKINNKKINYIYQLKEKESPYQPILTVLYYRHFCAKDYNDASESSAHRDGVYEKENIYDISEEINIKLVLYKNIGSFTANTPKRIYLTQKDSGTDESHYFSLGTHNFIKTYVNVRDIDNNIYGFFTHYASIIIPTYTTMRQYFTNNREAAVTNIDEMKQRFVEKDITSNTGINEQDTNSYATGNSYTMLSAQPYVNDGTKKYISDNRNLITLTNFNINIETEPILEQIFESNIQLNAIQSYNSIETAYNSFNIKFPLKVTCTSKYTSKYQVYLLMEINSFKIDTY